MLDDAERRLNIFFDALNNEEVSPQVIEAMMSLIQGETMMRGHSLTFEV